MTQFNFTTNIEHRMPTTGKVFCIDRMTSDYAEQHPLDVDGFIESVYQEFAGTEFEESRETLRGIWTAVLSVTSPRGDASLYPNDNGARRAAAMKVWHKAGDYWRRGLRQGDTLPDMVPMTNITRLGDGAWIAMFQKDAHLLEDGHSVQTDLKSGCNEYKNLQFDNEDERITNANTPCDGIANPAEQENPDEQIAEPVEQTDNNIEPVRNQSEPRQLDLFAFEQMKAENERLQAQIAKMKAQQCAERFAREEAAHCAKEQPVAQQPRRAQSQRRPTPVRHQQPQAVTAAVEPENDRAWLKTAGYIAAASVALLVIWQTGLIIPLGLIGLATSGFLK